MVRAPHQKLSETHLSSAEVNLSTTQPSRDCVDPPVDENVRDPAELTFDQIHDAVNFLSLPESEQNSIFTDSPQQQPSTTDAVITSSAEISEKGMCKLCFSENIILKYPFLWLINSE